MSFKNFQSQMKNKKISFHLIMLIVITKKVTIIVNVIALIIYRKL